MSISIKEARIFIPEDTALTDILISYSTIWITNAATLTLKEGSLIGHCTIHAPRPDDNPKPAIYLDGGDMTNSQLDTRLDVSA